MNESQKKPREITISRRMFFATTIIGGTAACALAISSPKVRKAIFVKFDQQPLPDRMRSEATSNRRSIFLTMLETCAMWAANIGLGGVLDRFGVPHGGRAADGELYAEQAEEAPVALYVRDCIVIPMIEEGFFRLFPSAFFSEEQPPNIKMHWGTGITSAALFAAIHNFSKPEPDRISLHFDSLPVEQFVLGIYCWWAQRQGGFVHAAAAHVLYNNLCEVYWHFYESKKVAAELEKQSAQQDAGEKNQ